ncbi:MAG: hypothetical protein ACYS14_12500, partial [Planctomycetota bacterium]
MQKSLFISFVVAAALGCTAWAAQSQRITLGNEHWAIEVSPQTLEVTARPAEGRSIQLSQGQPDLGRPANLVQTGT